MNYSLEFITEAKLDSENAFRWYESQMMGLGGKFINSLDATIKRIILNPYHYQLQYDEIRKVLLKRFPYQVIYLVISKKIIILGIIHSSRDPIIWENRM